MDYSNISSEIVFLRDGDIARQLDGKTISGQVILSNGVPAFDLFKEKYEELTAADKATDDRLTLSVNTILSGDLRYTGKNTFADRVRIEENLEVDNSISANALYSNFGKILDLSSLRANIENLSCSSADIEYEVVEALSAYQISVLFSRVYNDIEGTYLSAKINPLDVRRIMVLDIAVRINDIIRYAELPIPQIEVFDTSTCQAIKLKTEQIYSLAFDGAVIDIRTLQEAVDALNASLNKLYVKGTGLTLATALDQLNLNVKLIQRYIDTVNEDLEQLCVDFNISVDSLQTQIFSNDADIARIDNNISSISNDLYIEPNVLGKPGLSGKVDFLLEAGKTSMEYFGDAPQLDWTKQINVALSDFLANFYKKENGDPDYDKFFKKGFTYRLSATQILTPPNRSVSVCLYENDYFIVNKDLIARNATSCDVNIIRDAQTEASALYDELTSQVYGVSSFLLNTIDNLSDEVYAISNYLSVDYTKKVLDLSIALSNDIDHLSGELNETSSDLQRQIFSNDEDIARIDDNVFSLSSDLYLKPNVLGNPGLSGKVDFLLEAGKNSMEYFGNIKKHDVTIASDNHLSAILKDTFEKNNYFFKKGFTYRLSATQEVYLKDKKIFTFGENDYFIFFKDTILSNAQLSDIHVIRDAQSEVEGLSAQLTSQINQTSSFLLDTIKGLSDEVDVISNYLSVDYTKKVLDLSIALSNDIDHLSGELNAASVLLSNDYVKRIGALSTALSNDIDRLSGEVKSVSSLIEDEISLSIANVEKHINDNYDYSEETYFKKAGGEITGPVTITTNTKRTALALHQSYKSDDETVWLSTDFVVDKNGIGLSVGDGERYIKLNARDVTKILVNDQSLCSIISSNAEDAFDRSVQNTVKKISEISTVTTSFERAQVLASIKQDNGIVSITSRNLSIGELVNANSFVDEKVSSAIQDLSTTTHTEISGACEDLSAYIAYRVSITYKVKGSLPTYDELTAMSQNWITAGEEEQHIGEVYNILGGSGKEGISGLNYVWVKQAIPGGELKWGWDNIGGLVDFSNYDTRAEVDEKLDSLSSDLTSDYVGKILDLSNIVSTQIKSDYEKLSSVDFDINSRLNRVSIDLDEDEVTIGELTGYAHKLSAYKIGIIDTMSADISSLGLQGIRQPKFYKHVNYFDAGITTLKFQDFSDMFNQLHLWSKDSSKALNGLMFDVRLSNDLEAITFNDQTSDLSGLSIANGDYVFVNDGRYQEYIPLDELKYSATIGGNNTNVYVLKAGVQRFEYVSLVNRLKALKEAMTGKISACYSSISGINYDSDYKDCISATTNIKNLLLDLVEILKN